MGVSSKPTDFWVPLFTNPAIQPKLILNNVNFLNYYGYPFCKTSQNGPKAPASACKTAFAPKRD